MTELEFDKESSRHTTGTYLSFSMYQITWTILVQTQGLFLYFYYHTIIGLAPFLIFLATMINTIWGAFNDPLIGYLTDRNFKWTRRFGRRFPWIFIGVIPWCVVIIFIFMAPDASVNPWPAFIWLLVMLFLNELFITTTDIHAGILRADKFRTEFERRKYSGFFGIFDMIAVALGTAVPPLLLFFGEDNSLSYFVMAVIISLIALVCAAIFLSKGAREDEIIIERYYASDYERMRFIKGTLEVLKNKNFIGFWISAAGFSISHTIMTGVVVYVTTFVMQVDSFYITIIMATLLIGAMISVPIWLKILKRVVDTRKLYIIGCVLFGITLAPLAFFQELIDLLIIVFIAGFAMGCVWTLQIPVQFANIQDDFVIKTGRNQKGILIGGWAVLGLFTAFVDELLISSVFTITGFDPGYSNYADLLAAVGPTRMPWILWGIRILVGIIPMVMMLLTTIIFIKLNKLTHEKVLENKAKLKELGL